jgi:hypothetical protein
MVINYIAFLALECAKIYAIFFQFHLMPSLPLLVVQALPQLG